MDQSSAKSSKTEITKPTFLRRSKLYGGAFLAPLIALLWTSNLYNGFSLLNFLWRAPLLDESSFQWAQATPAKHLEYTTCFDGFQCARLEVPMNWNASSRSSSKVTIAIIKLPAKVPVTDSRYGGAILLNPGGPGLSGVGQVLSGGNEVQTIVDSIISPSSNRHGANDKFFDIIGFDARGVNNTTPPIKCFPDAFAKQAWDLQGHGEGILGSSETAFNLMWARTIALGESCAQGHGDEGILRNVNTAQVARDMLEIVERHGEWREKEAKKIHEQEGISRVSTERAIGIPDNAEDPLERLRWKRDEEKLQFWGFSYGSILGSTFATMFPTRVGRIIIDGIMDPDDYYSADWLKNLQDTDKTITQFCRYCVMAGPEKCPLYTGTGTSPTESEAYLNLIFGELRLNPIPVPASGTRSPEIITYTDVKLMLISALYGPYREMERVFETLDLLKKRNGSRLADMKQKDLSPICLNKICQVDGPYSDSCLPPNNWVSNIAISCLDGRDIRGTTKEASKTHMKQLERQSRWLGSPWAETRMHCANWQIRPDWSPQGNIEGQTSHPILIISNLLDPVTPLQNAHTMAQRFPGSVVLEQDSEGHCSYSSPSICTARAIRHYFQTGELPAPGTICLPDTRPFLGWINKDMPLSVGDQILSDALRSLAMVWL